MKESKMFALCERLIALSSKYNKAGKYQKCIHYVKVASRVLYAYNWRLADERLESILKDASTQIKKIMPAPKENVVVFFDAISIDNRGLTQQYIRAIIKNGYELCYMTNRPKGDNNNLQIIKELRNNNCIICHVPSFNTYLEKGQYIYDYIMKHKASKVFMHLRPDSVSEIVAFCALSKEIVSYQVNLTSHAFWLGSGCVDYSLEFNEYGFLTSEFIRRIPHDKLLYLPFYPISEDSTPYSEITEINDNRIVLMSGGVVYKITDSNDTFLKNVLEILLEDSNTIFLWAGGGDLSYISNFIKKHHIEDRFYLIGNRTDINAVFDRIDIYINTYPVGGGLMCQLAALHKKPILSFSEFGNVTSEAEQTICQLKKVSLTCYKKDELLKEANKLINDCEYRKQRGEMISSCVVDKDLFDTMFKTLVETHQNVNLPPHICNEIPHYFDQLNTDEEVLRVLVKELKWDIFRFSKYVLFDLIKYILSFKALNVVLRKINS